MILIFLILTYSSLANSKFEGFIVGGEEAPIERWAFITFVVGDYDAENTAMSCGGSLLSSQTVLTAAHCLDEFTQKKKFFDEINYTVFMGHAKWVKSTMRRQVIDYETPLDYGIHPDSVTGDIGIMFLDSPVEFISNVRKTILMKSEFDFHPSSDNFFLVAGWGQTDPNPNVTYVSSRLKEARLTSVSSKLCEKIVFRPHMAVCAEHSKNHAYRGDSGGPVVRGEDRYQLGIVSYREEYTKVTVFTSIPDYYKWINNTQYNLFKKHCSGTTDRV